MDNHLQVLAERCAQTLIEKDKFAQFLGSKVLKVSPGYCLVSLTVREEMLNGMGYLHGGITFGVADIAFAYASNSHNRAAVALDVTISFPKAGRLGDVLEVEAKEVHLSNKIGIYDITIRNQTGDNLGLFRGTVYRTSKPLIHE